MKNTLIFLTSLLCLSFFNSCFSEEECEECFTPPGSFYFQFIDADSDEDLIATGVYSESDLVVVDSDGNVIEYDYYADDENMYVLEFLDIGWQTEVVTYYIQLQGETVITLYVDAERVQGDCCSYTEYNDISITGSDYTYDTDSGLYEIYL